MVTSTAVRVMIAVRADIRSDEMPDQAMLMLPAIEKLLKEMGPQLNLLVTPPLVAKVRMVWWKVSRSVVGSPSTAETASMAAELDELRAETLELHLKTERQSKELYRKDPENYRLRLANALTNPEAKRLFEAGELTLRELLCHEPLTVLLFTHAG